MDQATRALEETTRDYVADILRRWSIAHRGQEFTFLCQFGVWSLWKDGKPWSNRAIEGTLAHIKLRYGWAGVPIADMTYKNGRIVKP